jgi:hypothetical protein
MAVAAWQAVDRGQGELDADERSHAHRARMHRAVRLKRSAGNRALQGFLRAHDRPTVAGAGVPLEGRTRLAMESLFRAESGSGGRQPAAPALSIAGAADRHEREAAAVAGRSGAPGIRRPGAGFDFSGVRVHHDAAAAAAAGAMDAAAYTVGRHIVFGDRQYQPSSPRGRALIAHELAHVVQQRGGGWAAGARLSPTGGPRVQRQEWQEWIAKGPTQVIAERATRWWANPANRQFADDLVASVREAPQHAAEILVGEVWEAIKAHWVKFLAVTIGLMLTEAVIGILTGLPETTLLTKVVAAILQVLVILILGYYASVELVGVYEEGRNWFRLAREAHGDPRGITDASKAFLRMVRHIILAILLVAGVRARIRAFPVPAGAPAGPPAGAGGAGGRGAAGEGASGKVVDISTRPGYRPRFEQPSAARPPAGPSAFGPGGTAFKIRPEEPLPAAEPAPQPAAEPVSEPVPSAAAAPKRLPGVGPGPAGVSEAQRRRPPRRGPGRFGVMRFQVQWNSGHGGPTFGQPASAPDPPGVTTVQAVAALHAVWARVTPEAAQRAAAPAVARQEQYIRSRPPHGISGRTSNSEYFVYQRYTDARVDVENLVGTNLRS